MPSLSPFPPGPKARVPEVRVALKYLRGAFGSVDGLFESVAALNDARRATTSAVGGRMATHEVDIVRAAITFTSSGLDASMRRLVYDAGRYLIPKTGTAARSQYELFLKQEMAPIGKKIDPGLVDAVISTKPEVALVDYYLRERTRASYQGSGDLEKRVRNVLGVSKASMPSNRFTALDSFFIVRNNIVHDMDYKDVATSAGRARHHRRVEDAVLMCDMAFMVASDLLHAVGDVIVAHR